MTLMDRRFRVREQNTPRWAVPPGYLDETPISARASWQLLRSVSDPVVRRSSIFSRPNTFRVGREERPAGPLGGEAERRSLGEAGVERTGWDDLLP